MEENKIVAAILVVAMHSGTPVEEIAGGVGGPIAAKLGQKKAGKTAQALVDDYKQVLKTLRESNAN
jgi:hypothetical protein